MEEEKDGFEFNDLETDERINIDIFKFEMAFPDPMSHCIGFIIKPPSNNSKPRNNEEYKSMSVSKKQNN